MRSRSVLSLLLVLAACETKSPPPDASTRPQDSATVPAPPAAPTTTAPDSAVPAPSTTPATPSKAAPSGTPSTTPPSPYIGRDSAFGPTFTVDPSGKVTPIDPTRKKP